MRWATSLLSLTIFLTTACSFGGGAPTATPLFIGADILPTSTATAESATTVATPSPTMPGSSTRTPTPTRRATTAAPPRASASPWGSPLPALVRGQVYRDPRLRFSFTIPSNWVQVQAAGAEVAFQSPAPANSVPATVNIVLEKLPSASVSLDAYDQAGEQNLKKQFPDYKLVSLEKVSVAGQPAYKRLYTATIAGRLLQLQQVYLIDHDTAYVISSGAPAESFGLYAKVFDEISGTFKIGQ